MVAPAVRASPSTGEVTDSGRGAGGPPLLHKKRQCAGHHAPERRADAPQREAAQGDQKGDQRGFAVGVVLERDREAALITFLVTLSGVSLAGIGSAFWGVVAGALALFVQQWRPRRRTAAADPSTSTRP